MWNLLHSSCLLLVSLFFITGSAGQNYSTYVVVLPGQDILNGTENPQIKYELVMTTTSPNPVDVIITGVGGQIGSTMSVADKEVYIFYHTHGMNGSQYANKSIIVSSSNGLFNLQVFVIREDFNHIEGYLGIPIESLTGPHQPPGQTVYSYVVATFCDVGGYCQLSVAALNDKTPISIVLPSNVEEIVLCRSKSYIRTKRDTTLTLNRFDALQLESTNDLTGTVIYSFMPIVVFAGSRNVTNGGIVAHTVEQLVPTSHWGSEYIVTNLGTNGYGDILKIVSNWNDTKVKMTGYPSFVMKDKFHTTVRRLDKGLNSHIIASHPIQVVQFTGLTYAILNETSALSMTVVPSVRNAFTGQIKVACQSDKPVKGAFFITSGKLSNETIINKQNKVDKTRIKYSDYLISTNEANSLSFTIENTDGASGIMKCDDQATMPTSVIFNENVDNTQVFSPNYNGGTCYEGGKASTVFDSSMSSSAPYTLSLLDHPEHVLQMRVKVCGEAALQFFMNDGDLTNSVFLTVTHTQVTITKCLVDCGTGQAAVISDTKRFNSEDSAKWNCKTDMAFFWFTQKTEASKNYFCFGIGKYDDTKCTGNETESFFEVSSPFKMIKLMGVASDAAFNWDFIDKAGCDVYESDWRCMDRWTNCSAYGSSMCSDSTLTDFVMYNCAKFCGKCFADSYGRKFLFRIPISSSDVTACSIVVSPLNQQTNVAFTELNTYDQPHPEYVRQGTRNDNGEIYYDCTVSYRLKYVYEITSDDDVAVVVAIKVAEEIVSARIYPVDTFGTHFMPVENDNESTKKCYFVSEHDIVNLKVYYSIKLASSSDIFDAKIEDKDAKVLISQNGNDLTGTSILFDKPSTVFCADKFSDITKGNHYTQLMPTNTWSTEYTVPAFEVDVMNRPFDGRLIIVSNADNTIVNVSGGFDAIHAIYSRGDKLEQEIDVSVAYRIKASENIAVALYLYDPTDESKSSYTLLPPTQNFHDTMITSVPNKIMSSLHSFDVTEIKTFYIDGNLNSAIKPKSADDNEPFYRQQMLGSDRFEITIVKSGTEKWFSVPGNSKAAFLQTDRDVCSISIQESVGDGIDNDCDGLKDEDTCFGPYGVYREDYDLDGGFGDDCVEELNEPVIVTAPTEPLCLEIKKPKDQCWTVCTCSCAWVEKYESQKNLTHDELVEAQQEDIQQIQSELKVDPNALQTASAQKESASDERQSAANIGYVGIGLFALVFGTIFIMDIFTLVRDACILFSNLREGFQRLSDCIKGKLC
ncbi:uncharacterized protein LOC132728501 [Ruditapes philippinarum]|uniref:uncharacterized protein LOC132728501 n=1 Tax=Ruditapes philippinarum TaxID=129788 RepID=UPI00295A71A1|nr:uncharacterized protein LOC132728501 [Ruditapes philippinarum]